MRIFTFCTKTLLHSIYDWLIFQSVFFNNVVLRKPKPAMRRPVFPLFLLCTVCALYSEAQNTPGSPDTLSISLDSGRLYLYTAEGACKNVFSGWYFEKEFPVIIQKQPPEAVAGKGPKFLTLHGNISYDYFYRSRTDTPYQQQNLQQHTERVWMKAVFKEKYPITISFTARQSNSPFLRNFNDVGFQFDKYSYLKNQKQQITERIRRKVDLDPDLLSLKELETKIKEEEQKLQQTRNWLKDPATLQKIIEERERKYLQSLKQPDTSGLAAKLDHLFKDEKQEKKFNKLSDKANETEKKADSLIDKYQNLYEKKKGQLDSMALQVKNLKTKTDSLKKKIEHKAIDLRNKINSAKDAKELALLAKKNGLDTTGKTSRFEKILSGIKSFNIGRSMLNYTELTAQNISITGVNIEYNPSYYAAFAAGKIDYRFRDFFNRPSRNQGQYVALGRFGWGDINKKAVIFTLFKGRKNQSEFALSDSVRNYVNILGYSIESIYKIGNSTRFSAEFAKSTKPVSGSIGPDKQVNNLWRFTDESNMGINIKAETEISASQTKLSGFYRKTGESFQSFSLFSYNTDQTAWMLRADQPLFKNKLGITTMLRRNDFVNPFTEKTFRSTTVFKSFMLNLRIPKYPVVSLGYYPGSQFYVVNKETVRENVYYILNGSVTHSYRRRNIGMISSLIYNRYFNKATDSGFVLYKGENIYAMQTMQFGKLQLQGGLGYTKQAEISYYTLDALADYEIKKWLRVSAGPKYSKLKEGEKYLGGRLQLGLDIKQLGGLRFQYEKSFLPTFNRSLYPVETGRVSWYKYF